MIIALSHSDRNTHRSADLCARRTVLPWRELAASRSAEPETPRFAKTTSISAALIARSYEYLLPQVGKMVALCWRTFNRRHTASPITGSV